MRALRAALVAQDALHRVQDELERSLSVITGEIHLGLADNCLTNSDSRVAEVISHFQDVAPAVRLHVSIRPPLDLLDDIRSRRLNFAVMALPKGETGFEEAPLFDEEFRLYVGADAPDDLNLDNLSRRGFGVVAREGNLQSEALASQAGCELRAKARGLEAVATLLASGRFVGFLPQHLVNALLSTFHFRGVPGSEHLSYRKTFSLVREELRTPSAAGDLFSKLVIETHQSVTLG
jgi:DNA-binding transcriptional LysR family regulator